MLPETMRTEVRARLGETNEDFWKDTELSRWLDEAMIRFSQEEKWLWLYSSVTGVAITSGTATLVLQNDVDFNRHFDLRLVRASTVFVVPKRVSPPTGFSLRNRYTSNGEIEYYYLEKTAQSGAGGSAVFQTTLRWVPTPNANYTLEYQYLRRPVALVDGTEPDIPEQYIEAIVAWATGLAWLKELNGSGKAQEQFNIYQAVLSQAQKDLRSQAPDDVLRVGSQEPEYPGLYEDWYWERRADFPL